MVTLTYLFIERDQDVGCDGLAEKGIVKLNELSELVTFCYFFLFVLRGSNHGQGRN